MLRAEPDAVPRVRLEEVWPDRTQRERALDALVADGLVEPVGAEAFALPGTLARSSRTGCRTAPSALADPLHRVGEIAHDDPDVP